MTDGPGTNPELDPNTGLNPELQDTIEWSPNGNPKFRSRWFPDKDKT
mgnify:CR=1 FL=1